jgi:hypothetical protein
MQGSSQGVVNKFWGSIAKGNPQRQSPIDIKIQSIEISNRKEAMMASAKQRTAARKNIRKAATAARKKRTIAHLSKATRTALGKQAAKVRQQKSRSS